MAKICGKDGKAASEAAANGNMAEFAEIIDAVEMDKDRPVEDTMLLLMSIIPQMTEEYLVQDINQMMLILATSIQHQVWISMEVATSRINMEVAMMREIQILPC